MVDLPSVISEWLAELTLKGILILNIPAGDTWSFRDSAHSQYNINITWKRADTLLSLTFNAPLPNALSLFILLAHIQAKDELEAASQGGRSITDLLSHDKLEGGSQ